MELGGRALKLTWSSLEIHPPHGAWNSGHTQSLNMTFMQLYMFDMERLLNFSLIDFIFQLKHNLFT